ncbi:MAG: peptidylprolyl isomerase [Bacteroidetes bacterium]|nr:peptidylprolyl isomerase [Bacteroidota bacterium]
MAVIGSIRKRGGLIAAVIGIALLAFVLGDFLYKGQSMFGSEQNAGKIAGNSISAIAFENEVQRIADVQKERRRQTALDEETMNSIRDRVWEKFVNELALKPEFQSAGISVSDGEVKELILGNDADPMVVQYFTDPNSNQIIQYFRDPMTGKLKPSSVKTYVDSLPAEEKPRWAEFEDLLRDTRAQNKYLTLIKKGLYVTTEQAKQDYANLNRSVNFNYIVKPYSSLADSLVKVSDQDMLKYYNENSYKYKQDASRKLEYVIFDVKPTQPDFDDVKNDLNKLSEEWKLIKSVKEDSFLVVREAESRTFDTTRYAKGQLPLQIDSLAHASEKGTVLPLFLENNQYKLSKVMDHYLTPDSVKARHILIKVPKGDTLAKAKAKVKIDSIKSVILKKHNFEEMAKKFSDDGGSKDTGGVLGWFGPGKMVPEFQNACFNGKKGELPIAFSQFGYHLIEILDQSVLTEKTSVATIDRTVEPGTKTRQDIYNIATDFITKYHTSETFDKGVEESHVIKRLADPLKENDKAIAGIENPREIIRWAFKEEKGAISTEPFSFPDKYVVAHLSEIREEGIAPLEQKKEEVEMGAKKAKKAEKFIEDMNKLNAKTIEEYASKLNVQVNPAEGATFSSYSIPNVGREANLYGPLFTMKQNELSKPVAGESGVYVVKIDKITEAPATTDYSSAKTQAANNFSYRADIEAVEAIKKKAEIKDDRAKFF